jgi:glyoxalase/bleomycin resistance protein/dioxygenase superfamily protein
VPDAALFKIGVLVSDLERAMSDLAGWLGLAWTPVQESPLALATAVGREDVKLRFAYSIGTEPHLELIEAQPSGYYAAPGGPHLHHVGRWVDDLVAESAALERAGLPREAAGIAADGTTPALFAFHRGAHGVRVELVDAANRANFAAWLAGGALKLD